MSTDINRVILVGRLGRDAEQSYTQSGTAITKFSIAVNRSKKVGDNWEDEANWFDVTVWGRTGEAIASYLTKGRQVAIDGGLRQERWTNKEGENRSKVTIHADYVQLIGGRDLAQQSGGNSGNVGQGERYDPKAAPQTMGSTQPRSFEDDIPF